LFNTSHLGVGSMGNSSPSPVVTTRSAVLITSAASSMEGASARTTPAPSAPSSTATAIRIRPLDQATAGDRRVT
jgi:hypothetical protein